MVEPAEGRIMLVLLSRSRPTIKIFPLHRVDGVDISTIGLEDLRTRIVRLLYNAPNRSSHMLSDHYKSGRFTFLGNHAKQY